MERDLLRVSGRSETESDSDNNSNARSENIQRLLLSFASVLVILFVLSHGLFGTTFWIDGKQYPTGKGIFLLVWMFVAFGFGFKTFTETIYGKSDDLLPASKAAEATEQRCEYLSEEVVSDVFELNLSCWLGFLSLLLRIPINVGGIVYIALTLPPRDPSEPLNLFRYMLSSLEAIDPFVVCYFPFFSFMEGGSSQHC